MEMSDDSMVDGAADLDSDDSMASRARSGAAVGAGFGLLIGAVIGWLLGAQVTPVPTIGPVVGEWVLPSTLVGLGVGAAIGALIGALAAVSTVRPRQVASEATTMAPSTDIEAFNEQADVADDMIMAYSDEGIVMPESDEAVTAMSEAKDEVPRIPGVDQGAERRVISRRKKAIAKSAPDVAQLEMEATSVSDEQKGRNPNTFTGTQDAVDAETGAIGTAGTPVTTGYGVSGSTVGVGSRRRRKKQENEDFRGSTPDSAPYEAGGRGTGDAGALKGSEREASVVDKNSDAGRAEASIPRDTAGRDVYEQSEGYAESLDREPERPTEKSSTQESAGTNLPGTADPRGLGDNTDGSS
jgi:hypothetical protein